MFKACSQTLDRCRRRKRCRRRAGTSHEKQSIAIGSCDRRHRLGLYSCRCRRCCRRLDLNSWLRTSRRLGLSCRRRPQRRLCPREEKAKGFLASPLSGSPRPTAKINERRGGARRRKPAPCPEFVDIVDNRSPDFQRGDVIARVPSLTGMIVLTLNPNPNLNPYPTQIISGATGCNFDESTWQVPAMRTQVEDIIKSSCARTGLR